jgi:UPF0716 protein FxsA
MVKWIIAVILLFPVAEIAAFVAVAGLIGLPWAFMLLLATTLLGVLVLRQAGHGQLTGFRVAVSGRNVTAIEADSDGFLTILGGFLLVLPGFITDLIGLLLLLGPIRRWCGATLRRAVHGRERDRNSVVDLAPDEWRQVPDRELENRRKPHDDH